MNLLTLLVYAPICGVEKRRPKVLHAVPLEAGISALVKDRCAVSPCGRRVRFLAFASRGKAPEAVVLWPPRATGEYERCRECWVATGKKRPRKGNAS